MADPENMVNMQMPFDIQIQTDEECDAFQVSLVFDDKLAKTLSLDPNKDFNKYVFQKFKFEFEADEEDYGDEDGEYYDEEYDDEDWRRVLKSDKQKNTDSLYKKRPLRDAEKRRQLHHVERRRYL